jgi:hypothetical protein
MFKKLRDLVGWGKDWFDKAMHEPNVNSRLVFFGTFVVTSLIMIAHTVVYLASSNKDPNYATIMTVLGGSHGVNGLARLMTKRSSPDAPVQATSAVTDAPQNIPTVADAQKG